MQKCSPIKGKIKKGQLIHNFQMKEITLTSIFKIIKNIFLPFCPSVIQTNQLRTMSNVSDAIKLSLQITVTKNLYVK